VPPLTRTGRIACATTYTMDFSLTDQQKLIRDTVQDQKVRITELKHNLERAQRLVRKYVNPGTSLVDELIAERRGTARNEASTSGNQDASGALRALG